MSEDYYSILGVPKDATSQDIKRSFRHIARECHPDVSGGAPDAEERFRQARQAYETLMDPVTRARYDRRRQRRQQMGGSFFDAFYNRSGGAEGQSRGPSYAPHVAGGSGKRRGARKETSNELDLEDLFNDFGDFGFGGAAPKQGPAKPPPAARPKEAPREARAGGDVRIDLVVPESVARDGGSATAVYFRLRRADSWRPGAADPGIIRVQDIAEVRIIPGTANGEILRERGQGDAGPYGGPYGDLVATIRIKREEAEAQPEEEATTSDFSEMDLRISVGEAILGGRVACDTPQGKVKLVIPPGTSSGTQMRIRGKGPRQSGGELTDLYVTIQIDVPTEVDSASRKLLEEFVRLNPTNRDDESA